MALHSQSKKPLGVNWPGEGQSREVALASKGNLGLLLGPKSDKIHVDVDCTEAKNLAFRVRQKLLQSSIEERLTADTIFIRLPLVLRHRGFLLVVLNQLSLNQEGMVLKQ